MTSHLFEDREKAHEKQFGDDQKLHFRASSLALKKLSEFASPLLGLKREEAEAYASSLIDLLMTAPDEKQILDKIFADFQKMKIEVSRHKLDVMYREEYKKSRDAIWNGLV